MGVMACRRQSCKNIMCHRRVDGDYICGDCWSELMAYKDGWPKSMPKPEVLQRVNAFMATEPGKYLNLDEAGIAEEFERHVSTTG